jgi:hypothetical protein
MQKSWSVQFIVSSIPGGTFLSAFACVDFLDTNMTLQKETCTSGQIESGFTYTLDAANLTHASVRASGIPAQTCSTDANFNPIGQCKPAAPMSVKATWTGQGPITYSTYTQYTPGVYRLVIRNKDRSAAASGTFNGKSRGQSAFADIGASITKEWGNPCGTGSGSVIPNGC